VKRRKPSINHIGLAVPNIADFLRRHDVLYGGFDRGPLIENVRQRVRELNISDGQTTLELLEPAGDESPIAGFLTANPRGGLIHVAMEVDDLDAMLDEVKRAGGRILAGPMPDIAFGERRIAFVLLDRHVTELVERG
jgi:methylmalonyl-CoA/ethylmalonyl-CoA epimerase